MPVRYILWSRVVPSLEFPILETHQVDSFARNAACTQPPNATNPGTARDQHCVDASVRAQRFPTLGIPGLFLVRANPDGVAATFLLFGILESFWSPLKIQHISKLEFVNCPVARIYFKCSVAQFFKAHRHTKSIGLVFVTVLIF
jgi:hypothetical protein